MEFYCVKSIFWEQMCFTRVQHKCWIIKYNHNFRFPRTKSSALSYKKKSPTEGEPRKRSNRISIARNEILSRRYVASSRTYYQRMTKIPEI